MSAKTYGVDFGTKVLKVYKKGDGVVFDAKNIIAVADGSRVIAIGDEAFEMYGKAPSNIEVTFPVKYGVIADIKNMLELMNLAFERVAEKSGSMKGAEFLIAAPNDITQVEKRAFFDLVQNTNVKPHGVRIVERPIADALGAGLSVTDSTGVMIVDIGADTTEISILSLGGIVLSKLIPIGGNKFDEDIISAVKKTYNLLIGNKTAEKLKIALATAIEREEDENPLYANAYGRDVVTGLPVVKEIDSDFVHNALLEHLHNIIDAIKLILERTPPEIAADIIEAGVYVTGGSANIKNLDALLNRETGLRINICDDPANTVVNGLGRVIDNPEFDRLAWSFHQPVYND